MSRHVPVSTLKKWKELVDRIISLTERGKLVWSETADDDEYVAAYGKSTITLTEKDSRVHGPDQSMYVISIRDARGKEIDSFSDEDIDPDGEERYFNKLHNLKLEMARRISGAEELLDGLLEDMRNDDTDVLY